MENKETKQCPYCGEEILVAAKKCKHCGKWLDENDKISSPIHKTGDNSILSKYKKHIVAIIAVVIAIVGINIAISLNGNDSDKIYITELTEKTETIKDEGYPQLGMPPSEYDVQVFLDNKGNRYEGEAWEKDNMTCYLLVNGHREAIKFYYPDGKIAYDTRCFYDHNGNVVKKKEFTELYYEKYKSDLSAPNSLYNIISTPDLIYPDEEY